jgi:hypothetical protein
MGAAATRPLTASGPRRWLAAVGVALAILACVPDLLGLARGSEVVQTLWYALVATVAPALIVLGAPWSSLAAGGSLTSRLIERLAGATTEPRGLAPSFAVLSLDLVALVSWRAPVLVDALSRHPGLVVVESATLVAAGIGLWLELVDASPVATRSPRPRRAVLAALAMWTVWTVAYLEGMSSTGLYTAFRHVAGAGLSGAADRQLSAAVLWAVAAVVFMPVVFWNLSRWLRAEGHAGGEDTLGAGTRSDLDAVVSPSSAPSSKRAGGCWAARGSAGQSRASSRSPGANGPRRYGARP